MSCWVAPATTFAAKGDSAIDFKVGGGIVTMMATAGAFSVVFTSTTAVALMCAVPAVLPAVTRPEALTVATFVLSDV